MKWDRLKISGFYDFLFSRQKWIEIKFIFKEEIRW